MVKIQPLLISLCAEAYLKWWRGREVGEEWICRGGRGVGEVGVPQGEQGGRLGGGQEGGGLAPGPGAGEQEGEQGEQEHGALQACREGAVRREGEEH